LGKRRWERKLIKQEVIPTQFVFFSLAGKLLGSENGQS
jgi:hypothetical protein